MSSGNGLRQVRPGGGISQDAWQALVDNQIKIAQDLDLSRAQISAILEERFDITDYYEDEEND